MARRRRRWHAPELSGQQAGVIALGFIVAVTIAELLASDTQVLIPLVLIAPFFVAAYGTPGQTFGVAAVATVVSTLIGFPDDIFGSDKHVALVGRVALAGLVAVWLADRRLRREHELARARDAAELGRRLELALSAGNMGTWTWDMSTNRVEWDDVSCALYGLEPGEFDGTFEAYAARLHPDDRDMVLSRVQATIDSGGNGWRYDHRCVWPDGSVHWVEGSGELRRDVEGEVIGATGVVIDIDARQRQQETERAAREASERTALQLDELRRAERETRELLDVITRTAPVGFAFIDTDLRFRIVNEKLAEINGLEVSEHLGRRVTEVVPDLAEVNEELLRRVLETDQPITDIEMEGETLARPGEQRDWLVGYYPVHDPLGKVMGIGATVVEITERRRAEAAVWAAATRAAILLELARALAMSRNTDEVADVILTSALPAIGARGGLSLVDRELGVLRHHGIAGYPQGRLDHWHEIPLATRTPITDAARANQPHYVETIEQLVEDYPHLADVRATTGDEAFVALPLADRAGEATGVLMVAYPQPRTFTPDERTFFETLASICGQALGRAQMTELEHGIELMGALDSMLDTVAIDLAIRDDTGRIVDFRVDYVNAARAAASGESPDQIVGRSLLDIAPNMKGSELFDAYARVVETGEPIRLEAVPHDQLFAGNRPDADRIYALQASRLGDGLIIAAHDVTERERAMTALRLSEAQLAEAQRIAHLGSWEWDASTGTIEWSEEMYRIYGAERGQEITSIDETLDFCTDDSREEVRRHLESAARGERSFSFEQKIMRGDGEVRITTVQAEAIRGDDGNLLKLRGTTQDVTEQRAAQEELFTTAVELRREQEVVEALQRAILPRDLPDVPGIELSAHYLPASMDVEVGGDWYDVFLLADGRLCLSVGDVAGHGVQSAATMGQLRNAFRAYAYAGFGPAQTLRQLDHLLYTSDESDWSCATCLFVEYTPTTGVVRWARAGHPHPLLLSGSVRELVGAGGPPLGAGVPQYDETQQKIGPGDVLFLYTDGLVERPGESLDVGIARLTDALDSLSSDDEFSLYATLVCTELLADRPRRDDVCVLALRVTGD